MGLADWRRLAACRTERHLNWWPLPSEDAGPALAICERCPATAACLAVGVVDNEAGIWGGTTEAERAAMLVELERIAA